MIRQFLLKIIFGVDIEKIENRISELEAYLIEQEAN